MPRVLTEETLKKWIVDGDVIGSADEGCAEGIKYDFRLGTKFLNTHFGRMVDYSDLSNEERRHATVRPGELVFVLTEERLNLPQNIYVQLSPKRKISHAGIQLLGGLTVDPGYKGHLVFGLCNLSSTDFTLDPGRKLVGAVFHELLGEEGVAYVAPDPLDRFPDDAIAIIKQYRPIDHKALLDEVKKISDELAEIKRSLSSDSEWKDGVRENLATVTKQLSEIALQLNAEVKTRQADVDELRKKDESLSAAVGDIKVAIEGSKVGFVKTLIHGVGFVALTLLALLLAKLIFGL